MLTRREIMIGKFYVRENVHLIREVIAEKHNHQIVYNTYDQITGKLLRSPHQECSKSDLIRWADREASKEEAIKLLRDEAGNVFTNRKSEIPGRDPSIETGKSKSMTEARHLTPPG